MFANLTDEQRSIQSNCAAFALLPSMRMRIIARAGTGKTTSLEAVVMKIKLDRGGNPSICYAAFNKTTETEFGQRINKKLLDNNLSGSNVDSRTLHSLCYSWYIATRNNEFIRDLKDSIETDAVVKYFQIDQYVAQRYGEANVTIDQGQGKNKSKQQRIRFEATMVAELILKILDNYLNSASVDVTDKHLPNLLTYRFNEWTDKMDQYLLKHNILRITASQHYARFDFKGRALALYQQSIANNEASGIPVTHSTYQKFAQLSNAVLTCRKGNAYNVYLVDEAQDLNECQCALITRQWQNGSTIALVGDPAQSIYQFRGACRQFERWEVECEETLTQSFRFGRQIARLANVFLGLEKLWLLSLKTAMEAKGMPVKKEFGKAEPGSDGKQLQGACIGAGAAEAGAAGDVSLIKALVRGLPHVQDKWVPCTTPLSYPHTVICRTNNDTYYALLAGIQEAVRLQNEAKGTEKAVFPFAGAGVGESKGDGASEGNVIVKAERGVMSGLGSRSSSRGSNRNDAMSVVADEHATARKRQYGESFGSDGAGDSDGEVEVVQRPPRAAPQVFDLTDDDNEDSRLSFSGAIAPPHPVGTQSAPLYTRHSLGKATQGAGNGGSSSKVGGAAAVGTQGSTVMRATSQVVTEAEDSAKKRRFYVNGVRSYAQLENGIVRRIEQLSTVSMQKPYMYKGEQYTSLDALKQASLEMDDVALLELVEITEQWGADIGHIKELISEHYAASPAEADVLVTTVHKSKGLEWDTVALGDDIKSPLGAQPLYVVQCNPDPLTVPAGTTPTPRYIVALELSAKAAYERINLLLCVGRQTPPTPPAAQGQLPNAAIGAPIVKPEPGVVRPAAAVDKFRDEVDVGVLEGDVEPTDPQHYPAPPMAPGALYAPSKHNTLVPLLPSTLLLGQQMQRGMNPNAPGGMGTPAATARASKCPLICCIPAHLSCMDRVREMYKHEVRERRRMQGMDNVCGLQRNGESVSDYRLVTAAEDGLAPVLQPSTQPPPPGTIRSQAPNGIPGSAQGKVKTEAEPLEGAPRLDPFIVKFGNRQNANEWYVAVTRAKHTLRVNMELQLALEWIQRDIGGLRTQLRQVIGDEADPIEETGKGTETR